MSDIHLLKKDELPLFQDDYIISWDFSKEDFPCVCVSVIAKEQDNPARLSSTLLGYSHKNAGTISLRQVFEAWKEREREEKARKERLSEALKTCGDAFSKAAGGATKAVKDLTEAIEQTEGCENATS